MNMVEILRDDEISEIGENTLFDQSVQQQYYLTASHMCSSLEVVDFSCFDFDNTIFSVLIMLLTARL
jgi:hypothetical protein